MTTLRIFRDVPSARAAGFAAPNLRDPDQPDVTAMVASGIDLNGLRGRLFDRLVIEPGVYLTDMQDAVVRTRIRKASHLH